MVTEEHMVTDIVMRVPFQRQAREQAGLLPAGSKWFSRIIGISSTKRNVKQTHIFTISLRVIAGAVKCLHDGSRSGPDCLVLDHSFNRA